MKLHEDRYAFLTIIILIHNTKLTEAFQTMQKNYVFQRKIFCPLIMLFSSGKICGEYFST